MDQAEAIHHRHAEIGDEHVGPQQIDRLQRAGRRRDRRHLRARAFEDGAQQAEHLEVVVHRDHVDVVQVRPRRPGAGRAAVRTRQDAAPPRAWPWTAMSAPVRTRCHPAGLPHDRAAPGPERAPGSASDRFAIIPPVPTPSPASHPTKAGENSFHYRPGRSLFTSAGHGPAFDSSFDTLSRQVYKRGLHTPDGNESRTPAALCARVGTPPASGACVREEAECPARPQAPKTLPGSAGRISRDAAAGREGPRRGV